MPPVESCGLMMQSFPRDPLTEEYVIPDPLLTIWAGTTIEHLDEWSLNNVLPCTTTKMEFVAGLTGMFNLHWYTNELSKTVYVEPFDTFYNDKRFAVDWTHKVNHDATSSTTFLVDKLSKDMIFRYIEDGSDGFVVDLSEANGYPWHSYGVQFGDGFLPEVKEIGTSFFSPTYMIEDYELTVSMGGTTAPWIPLIIDQWIPMVEKTLKPERADGYNFRILSYEGMQSTGSDLCYGS